MSCARLAVEESRDSGIAPQPRDLVGARQLRLVAIGVDHAEEAERLAVRGAELVPGHRRHRDEIARREPFHLVADEAMPATTQDQHAMHVLVALERGEAAG